MRDSHRVAAERDHSPAQDGDASDSAATADHGIAND